MCRILLSTCETYQNLDEFDRSAFNRHGPPFSISYDFNMEGINYKAVANAASSQASILCSPAETPDFILLWNGAILNRHPFRPFYQYFMKELDACDNSTDSITRVFSNLRGPFAFILVKKSSKRIYFGRDRFGQRSLVCDTLLSHLGSLGRSDDGLFMEVPASGIYVASPKSRGGFHIDSCYFWSDSHLHYWQCHPFNVSLKCHTILNCWEGEIPQALKSYEPQGILQRLLEESVAIQIQSAASFCQMCLKSLDKPSCSHATIGVLFSGGLDSTVIASLVGRLAPLDHPVDLINVAFQHLQQRDRDLRRGGTRGDDEISNPTYALPDRAPDRQSALISFEELQHLNPNRHWHLVLVDVSVEELKKIRRERVRNLIKPSPHTTLNDHLSLALWFAARGTGRLLCNRNCSSASQCLTYTSPARVLLTGLGADEQLAGYSRHRNIFMRQGPAAVEMELALEMERISERNLGRDDRIISDHGREAFYPFLDETLVHYLASLPLTAKADLTLPQGEGEKRLLREVAASLGLETAAHLPKRALQFGSRVAKAESLRRVCGADSNLLDVE